MVITRRSVLLAGGISLLLACRPSRGQSAATIRRVGWLSLGTKASTAEVYAAFRQGMHDLGWLEGKNVEYRIGYADSDVGRLDALANEMIGQKVEVIVVGPQTTRPAQRATKTVPIVFVSTNDRLGSGLLMSGSRTQLPTPSPLRTVRGSRIAVSMTKCQILVGAQARSKLDFVLQSASNSAICRSPARSSRTGPPPEPGIPRSLQRAPKRTQCEGGVAPHQAMR